MDIQMKAKKDEMKMDQQQEQFEDKMDLDSEKLQQDKQLAEARLKAQLLRDQSKKQNVR